MDGFYSIEEQVEDQNEGLEEPPPPLVQPEPKQKEDVPQDQQSDGQISNIENQLAYSKILGEGMNMLCFCIPQYTFNHYKKIMLRNIGQFLRDSKILRTKFNQLKASQYSLPYYGRFEQGGEG